MTQRMDNGIERIAIEDVLPAESDVVVPRQLLELCLSIIAEVDKHYQASGEFADDIKLAAAQLRCHLEQ